MKEHFNPALKEISNNPTKLRELRRIVNELVRWSNTLKLYTK